MDICIKRICMSKLLEIIFREKLQTRTITDDEKLSKEQKRICSISFISQCL